MSKLGLRGVAVAIALLLAACGPGDAEKAQEHLKKGAALLAEGKHEAAIPELKKATELNKDSMEAWVQLGNAHRALKKYDAAFEAYRAAKKIDRYLVAPHLASGAARIEAGQIETAIDELNHVIELDPKNLEGLILLGRASMMPRKLPDGSTGVPKASLERAELNLERAVELAPADVTAHYELAKAHERLDKKDLAIASWDKVRDLAAGKPAHATLAAEAAEALGRLRR